MSFAKSVLDHSGIRPVARRVLFPTVELGSGSSDRFPPSFFAVSFLSCMPCSPEPEARSSGGGVVCRAVMICSGIWPCTSGGGVVC